MIFRLADREFMQLMNNPELHLPKRWDGKDFEATLQSLLGTYTNQLANYCKNDGNGSLYQINVDLDEIHSVCKNLIKSIWEYHNGFPSCAFSVMETIMEQLMKSPLKVYQKTGWREPLENDRLHLFRVREVNDGSIYERKDIFHVPISARSKISTCRYSIAGYPSLYLSTSIKLALEETNCNRKKAIVSRYKLIRAQRTVNIQVLELGIKPQDFIQRNNEAHAIPERIKNSSLDLYSRDVRSAYLKWYPLIAACSFIRANRNDPFASEYIIPQLLMQWVRSAIDNRPMMGIRYFSCASIKASDMGFDYVFPVNNWKFEGKYCSILRDSFMLTEPVYIRDYLDVEKCEQDLSKDTDLKQI